MRSEITSFVFRLPDSQKNIFSALSSPFDEQRNTAFLAAGINDSNQHIYYESLSFADVEVRFFFTLDQNYSNRLSAFFLASEDEIQKNGWGTVFEKIMLHLETNRPLYAVFIKKIRFQSGQYKKVFAFVSAYSPSYPCFFERLDDSISSNERRYFIIHKKGFCCAAVLASCLRSFFSFLITFRSESDQFLTLTGPFFCCLFLILLEPSFFLFVYLAGEQGKPNKKYWILFLMQEIISFLFGFVFFVASSSSQFSGWSFRNPSFFLFSSCYSVAVFLLLIIFVHFKRRALNLFEKIKILIDHSW